MSHPLVVRRVVAAPLEDVFDAWTDPESLRTWMCPEDVSHSEAEVDPRVGGAFRIDMHGPRGTYRHTGEYLVVDRPGRLVFTWISEATGGEPTLVSVDFVERGRETEVVLTHERLRDAAAVDSHERGWGRILERLAGEGGPGRARPPVTGPP